MSGTLQGGAAPGRAGLVFYTLAGEEHAQPVPPGEDPWNAVAEALSRHMRREATAGDAPHYDAGTRAWTLFVTLKRRWRREEVLAVPVRW